MFSFSVQFTANSLTAFVVIMQINYPVDWLCLAYLALGLFCCLWYSKLIYHGWLLWFLDVNSFSNLPTNLTITCLITMFGPAPSHQGAQPARRKYTYAAASPGGCKVKWTAEEKPHGGAVLSSGRRSSPPPTTTASIASGSGSPSPSPVPPARPRPSSRKPARMTRRSRRGSASRSRRSRRLWRPDQGILSRKDEIFVGVWPRSE